MKIKIVDENGVALQELNALSLTVTVAAQAQPTPEPEPEPEPTPEPDPVHRPADLICPLNSAACINVRGWWNSTSRYERWQDLIVLREPGVTITVQKQDLYAGGGALRTLLGETYLVMCGNTVVGSFSGGVSSAAVTLDLSAVPDGWHIIDVVGAVGDEFFAAMPVFVLRGADVPTIDWMPVWTASKEVAMPHGDYRISWVPATFSPPAVPLPQRDILPFSTALPRAKLWAEAVTPARSGYVRRTNRNRDGILSTANRQWYTWGDFVAKTPRLPLLDGPRGVGSLGYASHISIGTGTRDPGAGSPLMGNLYVTDPWRFCRVDKYGRITTLIGYRHASPQAYWDDPQNVELVGDWSAIPEERRGCHELWGMCWQQATLAVDETAERIPSEDNRLPHITAPVAFLTDSQNNRVLRVEFNATAHGIPPKVTEFLTNLADPWDCVSWGDALIVSERMSHRICEYDSTTRALRRVIVQGAPLARVDSNRFVVRLGTLTQIRAEPVVAPEGLYVLDDWLYYASIAGRQVKRVHLATGEIQTVIADTSTSNANRYLKIAVSDGTFGPRGSVFVTDWTVNRYGAPYAYTPDGAGWSVGTSTSSSLPRGAGGDINSTGYSAAVGVGGGRLVYGGSSEGLMMLTAANPGEAAFDRARYKAGEAQWFAAGYDLTHGEGGYGFYGLPLPWGASPEIDYFLECYGHARP